MKRIERRHAEVAAALATGEPRRRVAMRFGIGESTLYEWLKDPDFQALYADLQARVEAMRPDFFGPTILDGVEALRAIMQATAKEVDEKGIDPKRTPNLQKVGKLVLDLCAAQRQAYADAVLAGAAREREGGGVSRAASAEPGPRRALEHEAEEPADDFDLRAWERQFAGKITTKTQDGGDLEELVESALADEESRE